jgi:hypothetical protein
VSRELSARLVSLFTPDSSGHRPWQGDDARYASDPHWRDLPLFHEYFHGDTGRGCGASHQTGWTAIVVRCFDDLAASLREAPQDSGSEGRSTVQGQSAHTTG